MEKYNNKIKTDHKKDTWMTVPFLKCSWGNINDLHNLLQNLHPKIYFIIEQNFKEVSFLDILIKFQNGQIIVDIYHKPI